MSAVVDRTRHGRPRAASYLDRRLTLCVLAADAPTTSASRILYMVSITSSSSSAARRPR